jgi:DNA-binding NarL/FixJ family response regulator
MRVLVADDHSLFRDGLVSLLEAANFTVVGQASNGQVAVELAESLHPELILLDLHMPVLNGLDALRQIKMRTPGVIIVMLTVSDDENNLLEAVKSGANGYLLKHLNSQAFLKALEGLQRGEAAITRTATTLVMKNLAALSSPNSTQKSTSELSEREIEILRLVAEGRSNQEVSKDISLSENTVKYHVKNILQKLGAHNRLEAVNIATRKGLLVIKDPLS